MSDGRRTPLDWLRLCARAAGAHVRINAYRHIHPPHLDSAFRSTRGEFELQKLPGGRTRLVGRTWYTLDIRPHAYWTIWTDWLVHRIHHRVLRHIKRLAEHGAQDDGAA